MDKTGGKHIFRSRETKVAFLLIAPVIILFTLLRIIPTLVAFYFSLTEYSMINPPEWVGLKNYLTVFQDQAFIKSLWNTLIYTGGTIIPSIGLALIIALLLNKKIRGLTFFRVVFYTPVVASFVSVSMIWAYIYNPNFGVLNYLFDLVGLPHSSWLNSSSTAMFSIILIGIWKNLGYNTIIFLAGLQGIPDQLIEAGQTDGLNSWQRFRWIIWPTLRPTTLFVVLMNVIFSLKAFDQFYVLTGGGPADSTTVVVLDVYKNAFRFLKMGYASAEAMVLFGVIILIVFLILKYAKGQL